MLKWGTSDRPEKAVVRKFLMRKLGHRPVSVWLPSTGAECLKQALCDNVIQPSDPLLLIEREDSVIPLIEKHQKELRLKNSTLFHGSLENAPVPDRCDYAYIDLMGSFNAGIVDWIKRLIINRAKGFVIDIAVSLNWRNNHFMSNFKDCILKHSPHLHDRLSRDAGLASDYLVTPMAMLSCALHEYDLMFERPIIYRDSITTMLVFRIFDIRNGPNLDYKWPSLQEVMSMSSRSDAARKAWETRRANMAADKRSKAGSKSWETRRANAERDRKLLNEADAFSKRSAAAYKAWETRRAKANSIVA